MFKARIVSLFLKVGNVFKHIASPPVSAELPAAQGSTLGMTAKLCLWLVPSSITGEREIKDEIKTFGINDVTQMMVGMKCFNWDSWFSSNEAAQVRYGGHLSSWTRDSKDEFGVD